MDNSREMISGAPVVVGAGVSAAGDVMGSAADALDIGSTTSFDISAPDLEAGVDVYSPDYIDATGYEPVITGVELDAQLSQESDDIDPDEEYKAEALEKARNELENEKELEESEQSEMPDLTAEQIRFLDEMIGMLTFELEELKKVRGGGLAYLVKQLISYFIEETFSEKPQESSSASREIDNQFLDTKINTLEKDILRLKNVRTKLLAGRSGFIPQPSLEMAAA